MRRFLNANLHINTSASTDNPSSTSTSPATTRSPQPQSIDQHNPLSSTKRAFQHTFGQLSRGSSSKSTTSTSSTGDGSQSMKLDSNSHASSSSSSVINSPVPPTPPSKHGRTLDQDDEHEEHDDSSWDDAFKLPFGSSTLITRASSSASASSAHASPYEGLIERTSSTTTSSHRSNSTRSTEHRYGSASDDEGDPDETARHPGQRASTATISASRIMNNGNLVSPSSTRNMAISLQSPPHSATSMLFSPSSNNGISPGLAVSATYAANASSLVDLKDEMMLELLSSDALIHVAQFEILGFDEVEDLRKEHSILSNRLQSLQTKLAVESKIRDAALSISRLYASKRLSLRQKQAAEEELVNADKKVEMLNNEVNKLAKKENEIKSRILKHMAAVLALSFRKLEAGANGAASGGGMAIGNGGKSTSSTQNAFFPASSAHSGHANHTAPSSVASSHTGPYTPLSPSFPPGTFSQQPGNHKSVSPERQGLLSPKAHSTGLYSPTFSTSSAKDLNRSTGGVQAFEGPHFFANNKDAIVPGSTVALPSPNPAKSNTPSIRSPSFTQLALFSSSTSSSSIHAMTKTPSPNGLSTDIPLRSPALSTHSTTLGYMDTSALDAQISEMTTQLAQSKSQATELEQTIQILRQEKTELALRLEELSRKGTDETDHSLRRLNEAQAEIQRLKNELNSANARLEENMKDASLWEEQSRKLQDGHQNEQRDLNGRLKSVLAKHMNDRAAVAAFLPGHDRLQSLDMQQFVAMDLDAMLSAMDEAHTRATSENAQLREELSNHQANAQQSSNKTADEARIHKRQLDQLQQEKQVLMNRITRIEAENLEIRTSLKELSDEHDSVTARHASLQERYDVSASQQLDSERRMAQKIQEVDKVHSERLAEREKALNAVEQERRTLRSRLESLQMEIQEVKGDKGNYLQGLAEVWKSMPSEKIIQARLALRDSDDVAKFKAVYLTTASSPNPEDASSLSPEKLTTRIQGILESDSKIISRLAAHEDHAASHKAAAIRAEKLLQESKTSLQAYSAQVKELEDRIQKTDEKEVRMLEKLNDLSSALESSRAATKKSEASVKELEKKTASLEKEKESLLKKIANLEKEKEKLTNKQEHKVKIANLEKEVTDLRDELASAQDELDELRSRESRQRVQLLDELTQLTEEASSLRAQLRTAQRKLASAGR